MNKTRISLISLFLTIVMLISMLSACTSGDSNEKASGETTDNVTDASSGIGDQTEGSVTDVIETESSTNAQSSVESDTNIESDSDSEAESSSQTEEGTELSGEHGRIIENAYSLANGVNAYFTSSERKSFVIENQHISFDYTLKHSDIQQVKSIKNTQGVPYIEDTMDVYVRMNNGITYYASKSSVSTATNLYRMGYYMYELRLESQLFVTDIDASDTYELVKDTTTSNGIKRRIDENGDLYGLISNESDPYIAFPNVKFSADKYNYVQIVMKTDFTEVRNVDIYLAAGSHTSLSNKQIKKFTVNPGDDYYVYNIPLSTIEDYTGTVTQFRLDINAKKGESFYIKEIRLIDAGETTSPPVALNRSIFTFSDKLHQVIQVSASEEAKGVEEVGVVTRIPVDKVDKFIIKDSKATHTTLDDVNPNTVEYVGFDIKDAGIFGLIIPKDGRGDKITVTIEDGMYVIVQSRVPQNNTIIPSVVGTENANDFYMGHRIYGDESHDFAGLIKAAVEERNPLTGKHFSVVAENSDNGAFVGYDPLRGVYVFTLTGGGFNTSYYTYPNKHYNLEFKVNGATEDRSIYLLSLTSTGNLECAALLDDKLMMLPIPLEVGKNFKGDGEDNIYNLDDKAFSDTVFPLYIKAGENSTYTLVNLYQNWGNFPLKQISWIQFHAPYYHLSTGVTETNCIVPWYTTRGSRSITAFLPDHRAMSAPLWKNQPQHTSGGSHSLLSYTDAEGNYSATENTRNVIDSYGPTYADIVMDFISDDGKIKASYTHMELPQTDENRGYYEIKLEVLEDVSFKNLRNDFAFYSVTDNSSKGTYKQFGYLNEKNEGVTTTVNTKSEPVFYVLGDKCPYFDYFDLKGSTSEELEYVNLSFLVYNSEIIIGGEKNDAAFIVKECDNTASISLDLGEVTLKAGDTLSINAIIMPWGSQESIYDGSNGLAPDQNVRDVRQNTLLDPIVAKAEADCEVVYAPFMPKFRTTNGKSAEFTISGGENNTAIRIYGFDMLTAPKIYEKIDGNWVEYTVSSSKEPDSSGYYHYYDGYCVYYDGDGTYSYSFVADMSGDAKRTFKITADEEFEAWPKVEKIEVADPIDLYLDHKELHESAAKSGNIHFSASEVGYSDGAGYIRFYGNDKTDSYITVYSKGEKATGRYFVMKYRIPEGNPEIVDYFELYTSTVNASAQGGDGFSIKKAIIPDGEWHILVSDLGARNKPTYVPDANGVYTTKYIRLDIFNAFASKNTRFDISYVGVCDTLDEIFALNPDFETIMFSEKEDLCYLINNQGAQVDEKKEQANVDAFDYYQNATEIQSKISKYGTNLGETTIIDEDQSYLKISSKEGGAAEGYFFFFISQERSIGKYMAIKYRATATKDFEIWSSTSAVFTKGENAGQQKKNVAVPESHDFLYLNTAKGYENDGEWKVVVIDLEAALVNYKADESGKFSPYFLRLDLFGSTTKLTETISVDIAYLGIGSDLTEVVTANETVEKVTYFDGTTVKTLSTTDGKEITD